MRDVEIYPSSWYYNACVHGFLEVLAWGLGDEGEDIVEKQFLQNDGSVRIPGNLMEAVFSTEDVTAPDGYVLRKVPGDVKDLKRIAWWWVEKSLKVYFAKDKEMGSWSNMEKANKVFGRLFYKEGKYPNLINLGTYKTAESRCEQLNRHLIFALPKDVTNYHCSFCNTKFNIEEDINMYESSLTRSISITIGSTPNSFSNSFWNGLPNGVFCPQCRTYLLFGHLNLNHYRKAFVNTDSLKLNCHLNKLITHDALTKPQPFINAIQSLPTLQQNISAWGLQNLELFSFVSETSKIEHMPISGKVATLLIQPNISSCLNKLPSRPVWELFTKEQFSYFPTLIAKNLAIIVKDTINKQEKKDTEIFIQPGEYRKVQRLIYLYDAILATLKPRKEDKYMTGLNLGEIRKVAEEAPLDLDSNRSLVFRLLELTKLTKKSDVYYLLLRYYTAQKIAFPEVLSKVLLLEDDEMFKTGVYAYISFLPLDKKQIQYARKGESI
jgi:CRISPR-associated protein Cst1